MQQHGHMPLPPYIERHQNTADAQHETEEDKAEDERRYQTVFAKNEGAVAAPTAGLHFSRELLKKLEIKGVHFAPLTLHVGLGTFRTVEVEDLTKHKMESEEVLISADTCKLVNDERWKLWLVKCQKGSSIPLA